MERVPSLNRDPIELRPSKRVPTTAVNQNRLEPSDYREHHSLTTMISRRNLLTPFASSRAPATHFLRAQQQSSAGQQTGTQPRISRGRF